MEGFNKTVICYEKCHINKYRLYDQALRFVKGSLHCIQIITMMYTILYEQNRTSII